MLAVILLGFLTGHVSPLAAKVGLIVGPILFYLLVFSFGEDVQFFLVHVVGFSEEVHFLHFLGFIFLLTVAIMLVISHFRPAVGRYRQVDTHAVELTPWRHARKLSIAIVVITIACYVLLAQ